MVKCEKCDTEIPQDNQFCGKCGFKIEIKKPQSEMTTTFKECAKVWYALGYMRGVNKDDKKSLDEFENVLKKAHKEMYGWYKEIENYWIDEVIKDDKELQEAVRLKRDGIRKTKTMQKNKK